MVRVVAGGKFWTCFSKQTMSGCVQLDSVSLEATGEESWPDNSTDNNFVGSFPEAPWLTSWKSVNLVSFIKTPSDSHHIPTFSFVGNKFQTFSASLADNTNPLFTKLFQYSNAYPVRSIVIGNYQYIFLHDNANEARSSYYDFDQPEKEFRRFSRVARICVKE